MGNTKGSHYLLGTDQSVGILRFSSECLTSRITLSWVTEGQPCISEMEVHMEYRSTKLTINEMLQKNWKKMLTLHHTRT